MDQIETLTLEQVEEVCPSFGFSFKTTDDLKPINELIGQDRAIKDYQIGLSIEDIEYNIYILGQFGTGRTSLAQKYVQYIADTRPVPRDWCYVYNFRSGEHPVALSFQPGDGIRFKNDMIELVEYLTKEMPHICAAQEYEKVNILQEYSKEKALSIVNLEYEIGLRNISYYIKHLREKYDNYKDVTEYLSQLQEDILENFHIFTQSEADIGKFVAKYRVNLLIDNSQLSSSPIIHNNISSYNKPCGFIEYDNHLENLSSIHMNIRSGSFHRANGGYLIIEAAEVIENWSIIEEALRGNKIEIKACRELDRIKPESIPLDIKIIVTGNIYEYQLLYNISPYFSQYFRILVQVDEEISSHTDNHNLISRFIKTTCDNHSLLPFSVGAVEEIIRELIRKTGTSHKITSQFSEISNIAIRASQLASWYKDKLVERKHIEKLLKENKKIYVGPKGTYNRCNKLKGKIGQVNSLISYPERNNIIVELIRVSSTTYIGKSGLINIEKGNQEIAGYLGKIYGQEFPVSLTSRIYMEGSYSHQNTDYNYNSAAQLSSLISSLSGIPIKQNMIIIGSVNQGGILKSCDKVSYIVEGLYIYCQKVALTENPGIIIPYTDINNLVLNKELIKSIENHKFEIYPVDKIEDALVVLTGIPYKVIEEKTRMKLRQYSKS